jgi:hypothetical protein
MKRILLFIAFAVAVCLNAEAQNNTSTSNRPLVIKRVVDIRAAGEKVTRELFASGNEKKVVTHVSAPKANEPVHIEESYDQASGTMHVTMQKLANGKVINGATN